MTVTNWESFIHSLEAVGTTVRVEVPLDERQRWPMAPHIIKALNEIQTGEVVQFDASILDGTLCRVIEASNCGWLTVEVLSERRRTRLPGWYLAPVD